MPPLTKWMLKLPGQTQQQGFASPEEAAQTGSEALPSADAMMGPDVLNPQTPNPATLPSQVTQPSFQQAQTDPRTGAPISPLQNPQLTKLGKLGAILSLAAQGALVGRASSEQAVMQSGGHRSGGAGMGFEAGYQLPFLRALQQQQVERGQAETQTARGGAQPVQTPYGQMPAALAVKLFPAQIAAASRENVQGQKSQTAESIQGQKSETAEDVAGINQRYKATPAGMFDTQTRQVIPGTAGGMTVTPEVAADYHLPKEFIGVPMKMSDFSGLERNQIAAAPTVKSSTDPLGLTTTSTSTKQLPTRGGVVMRPAQQPSRPTNTGPGNGATAPSALDNMAQQVVDGDADPSQVPKRGATYAIVQQKANAYSQQKYGKPFDWAQAASDYQYAKNPATQNVFKMIHSITDKGGSLEIAENAAKELPQMDQQTLNKVFNVAQTEFGSDKLSNFHTAMLGLADEYSKVMGGGVGSDTGRQQGLDLLKAKYSAGQFSGASDIIKQDVAARERGQIGTNRYLMRQYGAQSGGTSGRRVIDFTQPTQ